MATWPHELWSKLVDSFLTEGAISQILQQMEGKPMIPTHDPLAMFGEKETPHPGILQQDKDGHWHLVTLIPGATIKAGDYLKLSVTELQGVPAGWAVMEPPICPVPVYLIWTKKGYPDSAPLKYVPPGWTEQPSPYLAVPPTMWMLDGPVGKVTVGETLLQKPVTIKALKSTSPWIMHVSLKDLGTAKNPKPCFLAQQQDGSFKLESFVFDAPIQENDVVSITLKELEPLLLLPPHHFFFSVTHVPVTLHVLEHDGGPVIGVLEDPTTKSLAQKLKAWQSALVNMCPPTGGAMATLKEVPKPKLVPIVVKHTTEKVKIPLTDADAKSLGKMLADLHVKREHVIEQRKQAADAFREEIDSYGTSIKSVSRTLATGFDDKVSEVEQHFDFNTEEVKTFLVNGGKLISVRPMTDDEKQVPMEMYLDQGFTLKMPVPDAPTAETKKSA